MVKALLEGNDTSQFEHANPKRLENLILDEMADRKLRENWTRTIWGMQQVTNQKSFHLQIVVLKVHLFKRQILEVEKKVSIGF